MNQPDIRVRDDSPPTMDIVRKRQSPAKKWILRLGGGVLLAALAIWGLALSSHSGDAVTVDRSALVFDTARRGPLQLSISAQGVFAPERVHVLSVGQAGVVNQVMIKPGSMVRQGTVIAEMQNPTLLAGLENARSALRVSQAALSVAEQEARAAVITEQAKASDTEAGYAQDVLQAHSLASLHSKGLIADLQYRNAQIEAQKSANDLRASRAEVRVAVAEAQAKVESAQAQVDVAQSQLQAAQAQVDALGVFSSADGVVQSVDVEPGMSVAQGAQIARVADLHSIKAVLQVPEDQTRSVAPGMDVRVDDGTAVVHGRVARIAPSAQNGTVAVDVTFTGGSPPGARPDANVSGTILVSSMPSVISIERPAGAADNTSIDVFKVVDSGTRAVRTRIRLGQGSYDRVQVLGGLEAGDTIIVSDISTYANKTQLHLH